MCTSLINTKSLFHEPAYILRPCAKELSTLDRLIASLASILLGICTLGIMHAVLACKCRNITSQGTQPKPLPPIQPPPPVNPVQATSPPPPANPVRPTRPPRPPRPAPEPPLGLLQIPGSQSGCQGHVDLDRAQTAFARLISMPIPGVKFETPPMFLDPTLTYSKKGSCASMTLSFVDRYLRAKEKLPTRKALESIADDFAESNQEFRSLQEAFSAIRLDKATIPPGSAFDFRLNKMKAFLNFFNRQVTYASPYIETKKYTAKHLMPKAELEAISIQLENLVKTLPDGTYIVNAVGHSDKSPKLQTCGHQMVYIQEGNERFYYDPNVGVMEITSGEPLLDYVYSFANFIRNLVRFYRVE